MVSDELAPLEAHVEAQVKHLVAVAGVVRELQSVEKQYAEGYAALPFDVPAEAKSTLERLPQLQEISDCFSQFVRKSLAVKAAVADDLAKDVIEPLEAFTADHGEKAQHLLSELYELLHKENAFDLAYQNLQEICKKDRATEDNNELAKPQQDEAELLLHRAHMEQLLRKRDAERLTIQQWITALHFAGQRYEAYACDVLQQTIGIYDRMVASMTTLISEFQVQLSREVHTVSSAIKPRVDNNVNIVSEESWDLFMAGYKCHEAITSWMSELFKQMIPVEEKAAKSMQKSFKLDRAVRKVFDGVGFNAQFSGFVQFHGLLTINILNPIMRTLKFSRERQERMRKEQVKSLEETQALVVGARARLVASAAKTEVKDEGPVRCDSMTSSETSECSADDNNDEDQNCCGATVKEGRTLESTPEQVYLDTMERKLVLQRQEMISVLEQTSYLAVKTMELMVQDHVKHVAKALAALTGTLHTKLEELKPKQTEAAAQPWAELAMRLAINVTDQPGREEGVDENNKLPCGDKRRASNQRLRAGNGISDPTAVHIALSAAQTAVAMAYWATAKALKAAHTHLPPLFQDRVVFAALVAIILTMASICTRSSQLQSSWSDLITTQHSNSEDIAQIVKLSLEACAGVTVIPPNT
ncbi:unnamed protein product [Phytophthora lilii]|uniref:Unnamed protein product n=1 Tax=Phytophthora lilii TaxID=2077276 RepID=A0A9W6X9U6_9STRA|nr:unnamed protein product [Phytophthora lilii]